MQECPPLDEEAARCPLLLLGLHPHFLNTWAPKFPVLESLGVKKTPFPPGIREVSSSAVQGPSAALSFWDPGKEGPMGGLSSEALSGFTTSHWSAALVFTGLVF